MLINRVATIDERKINFRGKRNRAVRERKLSITRYTRLEVLFSRIISIFYFASKNYPLEFSATNGCTRYWMSFQRYHDL